MSVKNDPIKCPEMIYLYSGLAQELPLVQQVLVLLTSTSCMAH